MLRLSKIKPCHYDEIISYAHNTSVSGNVKHTRSTLKEMLDAGNYRNIVVQTKPRLAGFVGSYEHDGLRQLKIFVREEWRRKGVAKKALEEFLIIEPSRPIYYQCLPTNIFSKKLVESIDGFEYLGGSSRSGIEVEVDTYKLT